MHYCHWMPLDRQQHRRVIHMYARRTRNRITLLAQPVNANPDESTIPVQYTMVHSRILFPSASRPLSYQSITGYKSVLTCLYLSVPQIYQSISCGTSHREPSVLPVRDCDARLHHDPWTQLVAQNTVTNVLDQVEFNYIAT